MKKWRSSLAVYSVELSVGVVLGLVLLLVLLLVLNAGFPDATSLGDLIRSRQAARGAAPVVDFGEVAPEAVAVLSAIRHQVRDKPVSSVVWSDSQSGLSLGDRHAVQSQADSGATITFDDENKLTMGENTVIVVRKPQRVRHSRRKKASVLFMEGFLRGRFGSTETGDLGLEISAGAGTVRPHSASEAGSELVLVMDAETSALSVHEGAAEVVWKDQTAVVPSGHMVTYSATQAPGRVTPLPRPPIPISPRIGDLYRYRTTPPRVPFRWRAADDVTAFKLQIAQDSEFTQMVYQGRHTETTFVHGNLGEGRYHWRVFGLRGPIASPTSGLGSFAIEHDGQPPSLRVDLPSGTVATRVIHVVGATDPGCRVFVGDTEVSTGDDGRFEHTLRLKDGYNFIVLQAIDPTGNTAFENHTIIAETANPEAKP